MASARSEIETRRVATLLNTGQFSDMTVRCGSHRFFVHKFVMFTNSGFFHAAIGGSFKESESSMIDLAEDDASIIARILTFVYLGAYSVSLCPTVATVKLDVFRGISEDEAILNAVVHAKVFAMAEQYDIPSLRRASKIRFLKAWYNEDEDELQGPWAVDESVEGDRSVEVENETPEEDREGAGEAAESHRPPSAASTGSGLARSISPDGTHFSSGEAKYWYEPSTHGEIIRTVYTTTAEHMRDLRDIVIRTALMRIESHDAVQSKAFRDLLSEIPEFAKDLAVLKIDSTSEARCCSCDATAHVVVGECACGLVNVETCKKDACRQKWSENSFCVECYQLGTMEYPKEE